MCMFASVFVSVPVSLSLCLCIAYVATRIHVLTGHLCYVGEPQRSVLVAAYVSLVW